MDVMARAEAAERAGDMEAARLGYLAAIEAAPRDPVAPRRLGLLLLRSGRPREAAAWFQASLAIVEDPEVYLDFGAAVSALGSWDAADAIYSAALRLAPNSADARYGLAIAKHRRGRPDEAEPHYRAVIAAFPDFVEARGNLGVALADLGRLAEAASEHRESTRRAPNDAGAWSKLGVALKRLERTEEAEAAFHAAIRLAPDVAATWHNLTCLLNDAGRPAEATRSGRRYLALVPDDAGGRLALGNAAQAEGRWDEAIRAAEGAVRLVPDDPGPRNNLGNALWAAGRLREAAAVFREALEIRPDFPVVAINLANVSRELRDADGALEVLRAHLAIHRTNAEAWRVTGKTLLEAGRPDAAAVAYRRAIAIDPRNPDLHLELGAVATLAGWVEASVEAYRRVLRVVPNHAPALGHLVQQQKLVCDWRELEERETRLVHLVRGGADGVSPFGLLACSIATLADQRLAASRWARLRARGVAPVAPVPAAVHDGRLRLGYLSTDFREHAMARLMAEALESHDRSRFAVTAYSLGIDDGSPMRRRMEGAMERFADLRRCSDADAARRIQADGIDILVDLTGYTAFARTPILAARPAAIRVAWLGYPGTMGADYIDYVVADPTVIADDEDARFSEAVVRLPDCYQPNDRLRPIASATPTRAECGLSSDGFVFCCFNSPYKLTPGVFDIWARLVSAVPGSVLWLYAGDPAVAVNLRREFAARGGDPDRLVFAPPRPQAEHLARHRAADLFLDTLPYNAHTTASDALWAGLPVLTRRGDTFAGRVATSLLLNVGLPELIARTEAEYEALALGLARDPERLAALRERLARNRSTHPLFDTPRFTRHLEAAYLAMWDIRRAGGTPRPITITNEGASG